jgi:hypothetical protein
MYISTYSVINILYNICASIDYYSESCKNRTPLGLGVIVFNATFINISVTSWQTVLLEEETRVPAENNCPATSY